MEFPEPDVDKMTVSSDNSVMRENTFFLALQSTLHQLQIYRLSQILPPPPPPNLFYFSFKWFWSVFCLGTEWKKEMLKFPVSILKDWIDLCDSLQLRKDFPKSVQEIKAVLSSIPEETNPGCRAGRKHQKLKNQQTWFITTCLKTEIRRGWVDQSLELPPLLLLPSLPLEAEP